MSKKTCLSCGKGERCYRCMRCKTPMVCSEGCWQTIRTSHQKVCNPIGSRASSGSSEYRKIVVNGEHSIRTEPDSAVISLYVKSERKTAREAQQQAMEVYSKAVDQGVLKKFRRKLKVEDTSYNIRQLYSKGEDPVPIGFGVTQSVTLYTGDLSIVGSVLQKAIELGGDELRVNNVYFELREQQSVETEALRMATKKALEKAKAVAEEAGIATWSVAKIVEDGYMRPRSIHYEQARSLRAAPRKAEATKVEPGVITVKKQVELTLRI